MQQPDGLLDISTVDGSGVVVCAVCRDVDMVSAPALFDGILDATTDQAAAIVDLSGASYLDSAGVRSLFELVRRLRARGQQLRVVAPTGTIVRRVLMLTAFADAVPLDEDRATAIAALDGVP